MPKVPERPLTEWEKKQKAIPKKVPGHITPKHSWGTPKDKQGGKKNNM